MTDAAKQALKIAIQHIDHMCAWIGKQHAGYSFESIGEDMPGMRAALTAVAVPETKQIEAVCAGLAAALRDPECPVQFSPLLMEARTLLSRRPADVGASTVARAGGIYIASKTKHAHRWRFLRDKIGEPICSTWIDEAGEGESTDLDDLWRRCLHEAATADLLIVYREPEEPLKGAWIEMGAALANGRPVYAIGLEEFTIAKYRGVKHFPDMKSAIAASRSAIRTAKAAQGVEWQREVLEWAVDKFGPVALDRRERAMRFVEEAIELGQAEALCHREVRAIAERVFSRAQGYTLKEIAQAGLTLEVLAENIGVKVAPLIQQEIARIKSISKEEWQRRHAAKVAVGTALPSTAQGRE